MESHLAQGEDRGNWDWDGKAGPNAALFVFLQTN